jgi:thiol-disulfide isomerase/thioredoxin
VTIAARFRSAAGWAAPLAILAAGLLAMASLQARRPATDAALIELHDAEPAKLSAFLDAAGNRVAIESFRGKIVILNLWAPWCVPCLQEMPSLDRLAARLPEKDFAVVAVTKDAVGDSPSKSTFDRMGLKRLSLYLDPKGALPGEFGSRGFPTTLILGPDGAPLAYREGAADWDSDAMIANLDRLAGRPRPANPGS